MNEVPNSTDNIAGRVQIATQAELNVNAKLGSTGARLVVPCDLYSPGGGTTLANLHDVYINVGTLVNGDVLTWDSSAGKWENKPSAGSGGFSYSQNLLETSTMAIKYDLSATPVRSYSLQVNGVGGNLASWHVTLDGDLNNADINSAYWTNILDHNSSTTVEGQTLNTGSSLEPYLYLRLKVASLSLGTATQANIIFVATN